MDLELNFKYSHIGIQKRKSFMAFIVSILRLIKKQLILMEAGMNNSCIYSDIVVNDDTIRVYNIHLASNFFKIKIWII